MENLRGSGMIAGESSRAYKDIVTINLVSTSCFFYCEIKFSLTEMSLYLSKQITGSDFFEHPKSAIFGNKNCTYFITTKRDDPKL